MAKFPSFASRNCLSIVLIAYILPSDRFTAACTLPKPPRPTHLCISTTHHHHTTTPPHNHPRITHQHHNSRSQNREPRHSQCVKSTSFGLTAASPLEHRQPISIAQHNTTDATPSVHIACRQWKPMCRRSAQTNHPPCRSQTSCVDVIVGKHSSTPSKAQKCKYRVFVWSALIKSR